MNKVKSSPEKCKQCGYCKKFCPKQAIDFSSEMNASGYNYAIVDQEKCIGCGTCYTVCPDGVFEIL